MNVKDIKYISENEYSKFIQSDGQRSRAPPGWAIVESVYKPESLSVEVPVQFAPGMRAEFDIGNISHSFSDFIILGSGPISGLLRVYLLAGWGRLCI